MRKKDDFIQTMASNKQNKSDKDLSNIFPLMRWDHEWDTCFRVQHLVKVNKRKLSLRITNMPAINLGCHVFHTREGRERQGEVRTDFTST